MAERRYFHIPEDFNERPLEEQRRIAKEIADELIQNFGHLLPYDEDENEDERG